jgi:FkbM family methyltransferase
MKGIFFENFENSYIPEILKEIYRDRIYDPFLKGKKDLTILDVGANIGLFSLYAQPFARKIYSIEPAKSHFKVLNQMVEFNGFNNITTVNKAISHLNQQMQFFHNTNATMYSLNKNVDNLPKEAESVESITFKKLFEKYDIDHVDFMKLDIEGAEMETVSHKSFENVVDKIDSMIVEYHSWSGRNPSQLVTTLIDYGFDVHQIPSDATLFGAVKKKHG